MALAIHDISTVGDVLDNHNVRIISDTESVKEILCKVGREDINAHTVTLFALYKMGVLHQVWKCQASCPSIRDPITPIG